MEEEDAMMVGGKMMNKTGLLNSGMLDGKLLRFSIGSKGIILAEDGSETPIGADLNYVGSGHQRRGRGDVLSKIMFQHIARSAHPLGIDKIIAAIESEEMG